MTCFYMIHRTPLQLSLPNVSSIRRHLSLSLRFSIFRRLAVCKQSSPIHPLAHICLHTCSFALNQVSESWTIKEKKHKLTAGDCVFIDCQQPYSHSTDTDLWSLSWIHFSGVTMQDIYQKHQERGGLPIFHPENITAFTELHGSLFNLASSDDHIRDMRINSGLKELPLLLMNGPWHSAEHPDTTLKSRTSHQSGTIWKYTIRRRLF